jgi:hypothetical protein
MRNTMHENYKSISFLTRSLPFYESKEEEGLFCTEFWFRELNVKLEWKTPCENRNILSYGILTVNKPE